jgi:integrase
LTGNVVDLIHLGGQPLAADKQAAGVYLSRLAVRSRASMRRALYLIACLCTEFATGKCEGDPVVVFPWHLLRYQHTQAIRSALVDLGYAPATVNQHLAALRGVLREAWRLGLMDVESYQRAADVESIRAIVLPPGREVARGEILALFEAASNQIDLRTGSRDAALLALLYGGGLRRGEVVDLDLDDYNRDTGEARIVAGKGRRDRIVWLTTGARDALAAWLRWRGDWSGPLVCPVLKGGKIQRRKMSAVSVWKRARHLAKLARIPDFSPHDMRRSYISHMLDAGADLATVGGLAGHANVNTTAQYDRRGETTKKNAADLLIVPFCKQRETEYESEEDEDPAKG